jgi:uncharacterized protein YidB (DUF937 family)
MSKHATRNDRSRTRTLVAASFGVGALALTGAGVYAGLQADATGTEAVSSGTLKLVQAAAGTSGGFGQTYSDMAPGDAVNTYVDVTDNGTIAGKDLTLAVTGTGSTLLTTDATKGLHVTVQSCAVAWVAGSCLVPTTVINNAAVANLGTPSTLVSGAVTKNSAYHYKVTTTLPDQNETTTNGTLPGGTIQGLSTTLTFTFSETQRAATTTES